MASKIVGITGLAGSGKDTFAGELIKRHGFVKHSFARALKVLCCDVYGWDLPSLEVLEYKEEASNHHPVAFTHGIIADIALGQEIVPDSELEDACNHLFAIFSAVQTEWTRRRILQWIGTEGFRKLDHDHWVKRAMSGARGALETAGGVVFTDVRFDNEAEAILAAGGVVVETIRVGQARSSEHASELGINQKLVTQHFAAASGELDELRKGATWLVGLLR